MIVISVIIKKYKVLGGRRMDIGNSIVKGFEVIRSLVLEKLRGGWCY